MFRGRTATCLRAVCPQGWHVFHAKVGDRPDSLWRPEDPLLLFVISCETVEPSSDRVFRTTGLSAHPCSRQLRVLQQTPRAEIGKGQATSTLHYTTNRRYLCHLELDPGPKRHRYAVSLSPLGTLCSILASIANAATTRQQQRFMSRVKAPSDRCRNIKQHRY